jgi:bacteriorhodopsin
MNALNFTAIGSLVLQLITGLVEVHGVFMPVTPKTQILQDILTLELSVQAIEFMFYLYLVYMILTNHVDTSITRHRYVDWAITTPAMLVSFVLFFKYYSNPNRTLKFWDTIVEEKETILKLVIANALMLLCGYLAELGIINITAGVTLGFIPFFYIFWLLYDRYVKHESDLQLLYYPIVTIWVLYGIAAYLPFARKNTMYNILDLFAKNFYGLFLYVFLRYKNTN